MALTAPAPPEIETTIISSLHLKEPVVVTQQLDRPNIYVFVHMQECGIEGKFICRWAAELLVMFASLFMQRDLGQLAHLIATTSDLTYQSF